MYNLDKITSKLEAGELAVGSHVAFDSPFLTEMIAGAGFDFIWIDAEHGALDRRDIQTHLLACRAAGAAGLVRVPSKDPDGIKGVLDMGADGVIIPMVNTVEEARAAAAATHYPPDGIRGMGLRRACNYGMWDKDEYLCNMERHVWTAVQIEHVDALAQLEQIAAVPGINAFVIGPNDFSMSLRTHGREVRPDMPEAQRYFDRISEILLESGKPFGVSGVCTEAFVEQWVRRGASFLSVNFDFHYVVNGARTTLQQVRRTAVSCRNMVSNVRSM